METAQRILHALFYPFRAIGDFLRALINMDRRQMRALFSVAMLGGIVSLSFQNIGLIMMVRNLLKDAGPGSLFGQMALNQQWWNNAIMAGFATILGMVVWGADYLKAKYGDKEFEAGKKGDEE